MISLRRSILALAAALPLLCFPLGALPETSAEAAEQDRGRMLSAEEAREWRGVGRVNIGGVRSRGLCTGVLIRPDVVLTAAHCVVHQRTGVPQRLSTIHFVAGWYKGEISGHSTAAALAVHPFYDPHRENSMLKLATDLALIRLRDSLSPEAAEPFAVAPPPAPGAPILVVSYRRDRAHAPTYQDECSLDGMAGPLMMLACPVVTGASGAPVLAEIDGEPRVIGTLVAKGPNGQAYAVRVSGVVGNLLSELENSSGPGAGAAAPDP